MNQGEHVQTICEIVGSKKNIYAESGALLTIHNTIFFPVLIVSQYQKKELFPVHVDKLTAEIHPKNLARIKIK